MALMRGRTLETAEPLWVVGNEYFGSTFSKRGLDGTTVSARLVREPQNRADKNAVGVHIGSKQVGYLSSARSEKIIKWIDSIGGSLGTSVTYRDHGADVFVPAASAGAATKDSEVIIQDGTLEFSGSSLSIGLPLPVTNVTQSGAATGMVPESGLGVVVAPVDEGTARVMTLAEGRYSTDSQHEYRYDLELGETAEPMQLSTGEVVLVDTVAAPAPDEQFAMLADVDIFEFEAGLADAADGLGAASDRTLASGEAVVGAFMTPWSVDSTGKALDTHYELEGNTLIQVVDTSGATFPVVSDPVSRIVIGIVAAIARIFAPVALRAFATVAIRAGAAMTTHGGFATFNAFKSWAGAAKPGYQWHHIVGPSQTRFPAAARHNPQNLIMIPTTIHQKCINSWISRKAALSVAGETFRSIATVRAHVESWTWTRQHTFGVKLLRHCGVSV